MGLNVAVLGTILLIARGFRIKVTAAWAEISAILNLCMVG